MAPAKESVSQTDWIILQMGAFALDEDIHVNKPTAQRFLVLCTFLAEELRDLHNRTGISLDNWATAREFVEAITGPVEDNHA